MMFAANDGFLGLMEDKTCREREMGFAAVLVDAESGSLYDMKMQT